MRRVRYIAVDKELYHIYAGGIINPKKKKKIHLELFYPNGRIPETVCTGNIEDLEDYFDKIINKKIEGEATRLFRDHGLVPHPILTRL
jgi:hypothetical protein